MGYSFNPFTGTLDLTTSDRFAGVFTAAPLNVEEGTTYINSTDNGFYLYAGGIWWLWKILSPTSSSNYNILLEDGFGFLLENSSAALLENALPTNTDTILLEDDTHFLLEYGGGAVLEDNVPIVPPTEDPAILLEDGGYIRLEDGWVLLAESGVNPPPSGNEFTFISTEIFTFIDGSTFEVIS